MIPRPPVLDGATRLVAIIGDPIAQVKSPAGVTAALQSRGRNAVCVPIHVPAADVDGFLRGATLARNLDGIIATVPHKFAAFTHCATVTPRARLLAAANTLRRAGRGWHGDQLDGEGFVAALRAVGCDVRGRRALLAGAGGAGSAIGLALLEAGVGALGIHDRDPVRRDGLLARLGTVHAGRVHAASADPAGCTIVVNATPSGLRPEDACPVDVEGLTAGTFVGDAVTATTTTSLIDAARRRGCRTVDGSAMFAAVAVLMVDFLLAADPPSA